MIEALTDKKTWLFALFAALANVPNSITNQLQIIISSLGFTILETTLLGCVNGAIQIIAIYPGVTIVSHFPNSRAWVAILAYIPNVLSVFLVNFLPWHDKVGLLFSVWLSGKHNLLRVSALKELFVASCCDHWLCHSHSLGIANYGRAYKESHDERHYAIWSMHRQCCRAVHVASQIQTSVSKLAVRESHSTLNAI